MEWEIFFLRRRPHLSALQGLRPGTSLGKAKAQPKNQGETERTQDRLLSIPGKCGHRRHRLSAFLPKVSGK